MIATFLLAIIMFYDALTDAIFQNGYIIRKVRVHVTLRQFIITEAFCREV